jgi:peptide/nickel transport system substrate-binding protein
MGDSPRKRQSPIRRHAVSTVLAVVLAGSALAACGGISSSTGGNGTGTIVFAEAPGASPNYIFPYMGCAYFSVSNVNQFQQLMYRPVYFFGLGSSSAVQPQLSQADQPVFSDSNKTVTLKMKGWKFSNGETIDAQAAMFFLNMYKADPTSFCGYNQGYGIPDQLASASGSGNTVTLHFSKAVNPNWILYNYLSEITAMPQAWDKTSLSAASGSGGCAKGVFGAAATNTACKAVEKFLDAEALKTTTYTQPLWQIVSGPWKLSQFDSLGNVTLVPNTKYSGPQKAQVAEVQLKAYTSSSAEQNDLYSNKLTFGFVDPAILPGPAKSPGEVGPQVPALKGKYNLATGSPWAFNYAPFNFSSSNPKAPEIRQLYIRQAIQQAVNQIGIIKSVDKGYGVPTCSPIPPNTPSSISSNVECAYPFNLADAKALLTDHGWNVQNGVQTCVHPGTASNQCGEGIAAGSQLKLDVIQASGTPFQDQTMNAQIAAWKSIGIVFSHSERAFNSVIQECNGGTFQICWWGGGWVYAPDYYPSGETFFTPTGGFNPGSYSNAHMTQLINDTTFGSGDLTEYGTYAAQQLPVLYEPNATATNEVSVKLKGVLPVNPLSNFMPEYNYF